jgi:3-hydroxyacyl-CoA dehydrogenase
MASNIKTVGVISTGVIGSSFIALCLARGLRVLVCMSSPASEDKLKDYIAKLWPSLDALIGLSPGASPDNWKYVGSTLEGYYDQVDFVQEVSVDLPGML